MNQKIKSFLVFAFMAILVIGFTPWFGGLYEQIIGRKLSSGFWGPDNPEYIPGFFLSYSVFVPLLLVLFFDRKNKYKFLSIFLGVLFLLDAFLGVWDILIYNVIISLAAWLLAELILVIYYKFKK